MTRTYVTRGFSCILAAVVMAVSLGVCAVAEYFNDCDNVRDNVLRLHVIADSDDEKAQQVKLMVRDTVLEAGAEIFDGSVTAKEAQDRITPYLDLLEQTADSVLRENGFDYSANAMIVNEYFDVREYGGMEDVLRTRYPRNIMIAAASADENTMSAIRGAAEKEAAALSADIDNLVAHKSMSFAAIEKNGMYYGEAEAGISTASAVSFKMILLEDYNTDTGKNIVLSPGEVLVQTVNGKKNDVGNELGEIRFENLTLTVRDEISDLPTASSSIAFITKTVYLVVRDEEEMQKIAATAGADSNGGNMYNFNYDFDTASSPETEIALCSNIRAALEKAGIAGSVEGAESSRDSFYSLYGGLLFIGIFLGLLFLLATVLIIYYKQISEGFDDSERFKIMQNVGMDKKEVKSVIRSQVLTVFFLPLGAAVVHLCFAFPIISRLMALLNLTNISIFVIGLVITAVVFAAVYAAVYSLTAKAYMKIVSQ